MKSVRAFVLAFAIAFALLLCTGAALVVRQVEAFGRAQTSAQLLDTTRAVSLAVAKQLEGYQAVLQTLAASEAMQERDLVRLDVQARAAISDADAWIVLGDRTGQQLINTRLPLGAPLKGGNLSPQIWAELDTGRPRSCNLVQGKVERHILCVDLPIMRDGRAEYHLTLVFRPRVMQRIIDAQKIPLSRYATILDREGTIVWRNVRSDRYVGRKATPDLLKLLQETGEGVTNSRSLEGVPTVVAFSRSPVTGWTFTIAMPRSEPAAGARAALQTGALLSALFITAAGLLALFGGRRLAAAIEQLNVAAKRIHAGEPPAFQATGFSEIDDVGETLQAAIVERDLLRERFDLAQEVGGIGSWDWDTRTDEGRVSETYKAMHGLDHIDGRLKLADVVAVIHPDDREGYLERLAAAKERREASINEYRVVRADGRVCWVSAKGRPIFDEDGKLVGAVGIVRDATADHEAQEALRRLNELLERQVEERTLERDRLWDIAKDPFVVADDKGVWLAASPAWTQLLGYELDELIGRTSEWMEHPDDRLRTRAEDQKLASGEITDRFENRFRAKDGTYKWLSWTAVPEGGRFYSVARDITAEKAQAKALRDAEEALRQTQKLESIGQITGGVAHDFNNLLSPILGTLDLLQQRGLPDARSERMVANALEAAERARMLVQRLLAFARRQPLKAESTDLAASLRGMESLLQSSLGAQIALQMSIEEIPPVVADGAQVELALLNLAVNARDAMPTGGRLSVSARARQFDDDNPEKLAAGPYVEVQVADTGAGMAPSVVERAIEPFFSTKGLGRGTGLGLSMVHGLMAQLGGGMRIDSALGEGTTITLWLRVADQEPIPVAGRERPTAQPNAGRALVVDDEAVVRASGAEMLRSLGYEVLEAASAQAAMQQLEMQPFDLLVTDHLMPGMSGTELARQVMRLWPSTKVLVVSGYADVEDIAPDLPRLSKPFRQADLANAISTMASADPAAQ